MNFNKKITIKGSVLDDTECLVDDVTKSSYEEVNFEPFFLLSIGSYTRTYANKMTFATVKVMYNSAFLLYFQSRLMFENIIQITCK